MNWPTHKTESMCDVEMALRALGIDAEEVDGEFKAACPGHVRRVGHEDRHPSWSVNMFTGWHFCFSCGFGGSFVTVVQEVLDCSLADARKWLKDYEVEVLPDRPKVHKSGPEVWLEDLDRFDFVPYKWAAQRLLDVDVCDDYSVRFDKTNEDWILPAFNDGTLLGWQRKSATSRWFSNEPKGMRIKDTLFGWDLAGVEPVVVVESPLDALRLCTVDWTGVATWGSRVSREQLDLLTQPDYVILAMDNDEAGHAASLDIREKLSGRAKHLYIVNYGDSTAKDIGEMPERSSIDSLINSAVPAARYR